MSKRQADKNNSLYILKNDDKVNESLFEVPGVYLMSIQQLSPNSIVANPAHVNPQARADQTAASPQVNQDAQRSAQALKTDTVTISKQALQMLANGSDSAAPEIREN
jgi:hypothetical protein